VLDWKKISIHVSKETGIFCKLDAARELTRQLLEILGDAAIAAAKEIVNHNLAGACGVRSLL